MLENTATQEKARKCSVVSADSGAILATGKSTIKEKAKKELAMAIEVDRNLMKRRTNLREKGKLARKLVIWIDVHGANLADATATAATLILQIIAVGVPERHHLIALGHHRLARAHLPC